MAITRKLVVTKPFEKAYKKFTNNNTSLKKAIDVALLQLAEDAYHRNLKTHKLSGKLSFLFACSCGYDCRIIWKIEKDNDNPELEIILLLNIGTHDEVY